MGSEQWRVPPEALTKVCDPDQLGFETTEEVLPLAEAIGQERAVTAMELGLDMDSPGFNVFVAGTSGTGRTTTLRTLVEKVAAQKSTPPDWGYVYNFQDPARPIAISLPCGMMKGLAQDMDDLVETCRREIPRIFESEEYSHRVEEVLQDLERRRESIMADLERQARQEGFTVTATPMGMTPVPLLHGRPMTQEEFNALPSDHRDRLRQRADQVQRLITHAMHQIRRLNKEAAERGRQVDREVARFTITPIIQELKEKYQGHSAVVDYLSRVEEDMVEHLDAFKPQPTPPVPLPIPGPGQASDAFQRYKVNVLVDNSQCRGAPVVFEYSPTYYNLFGRIDYRAHFGTLTTDLTMIRPGSLHRANGGYLVLQARDLLTSPLSWETLKRSLRSGEIRIENIGEQYSPLPSLTLRPQPIPLSTKVVIVGGHEFLRLLQLLEEDFRKHFKVVAEFDTVMDRTPENMAKYAAFVALQCRERGLRPFHKTAVAALIDHSSRLAQHQEKLTTRFMEVTDIVTEADYWARKEGSPVVMAPHVEKAVQQRRYRAGLTEERLQELIEEGTIHIDTEGAVVGQVNGLAVLTTGDYTFGKPSRITARVALGRGQVVNIERETRLSGPIHDKGFMILTGYLQGKYGIDRPLSLTASIGFEQTYSEVEGDSASSTELYALLSALSGLPIDQGIAVTGAVNQMGQVQAIGGASEKVEGFFDVCKAKGLTGRQGVIIPKDNVKHLLLRQDVVEAVREGKFHIYAVSTVDEGIEVLTGVPAGERQEDGSYPEGTVHYLVEKRLEELARKARELGRAARGEEGQEQREDGQ